MDFNPYLGRQKDDDGTKRGGTGYIEAPDDVFMNLVWQNRTAAPSDYETTLCDTLSGIFAGGSTDIADVVRALNESSIKPAEAGEWTEENFAAEMHRLGA